MPPKKSTKRSKKASRFPLFRVLALVGVILITGMTLLLVLRLASDRPSQETSSAPRPVVKQSVAPRPAESASTPRTTPSPSADTAQTPSSVDQQEPQALEYEAVAEDFEAKVREVDLAILEALDRLGESDADLRHRAVESRRFNGQEFHYQNLTIYARHDVFDFLAELRRALAQTEPTAAIETVNENPRDLEISIQGQPTHHLFLPLPSTPPQPEQPEQPTRHGGKTPRLVIIIDDLGESAKTAQRLSRLPVPVTFSILPFTTKAREVAGIARKNNRELFLHLPCEPEGYPRTNSGPGTLRLAMSPAELERTLVANLARLPEVDGVNNHMGSKLTQDKKAMRTVLAHLKGRGKFFVDSLTTPKSCVAAVSSSLGMRYYRRHIFLDNTAAEQAILLQLKKAEALARKNGVAVAIGHPYPATLAALEAWAEKRDREIIICKMQDI